MMFEQRELESAGNEAEAMAEESNALGEFEQKDKYSISTIVDVGNDAYKTGVKAERSRMREVVEGTEPETRFLHISRSVQDCWLIGKEDMKQAILKAMGD